ncbi:hypothetical protein AVEN_34631-1 [Araneus ventricosus]|uniref:Helitron helicase-like domain-containing protein n=1 Tax=Araneus ventricosus TaxID=182803 RepID=A0A4Y2B009_ARAVE|nr:hypothetical protein AVEN_34631-1 [Araneus ventricosus]
MKDFSEDRPEMPPIGLGEPEHAAKPTFPSTIAQYVVDSYAKIEGSRLYIHLNQKDLRVEFYRRLLDALTTRASNNNLRLGKLIILPSSFQGSPCSRQQNYQDTMAMVRKFGRPDLIVTFTFNPSWFEILNAMQGRERPENRPDIVVRVFKMKLSKLLDDLIKHKVFGCITSYIYAIEFQKLGLSHCHNLLTLDSSSKLRTKDDIISAELPNINVNRRLFEIVTKCIVYGPCGIINPKAPCMKDGEFSKQFPKAFRQETEENVNGYPVHQRRCIEPVRVGIHYIDNRWIVPYNPWLSKKYNAHINVEVCASVKSVKYLYKYVYKDHDEAPIKLKNDDNVNHDEI